MQKFSRWCLMFAAVVALGAPAFGVGGAAEWPFSALPADALAYVEIPSPQELAAGVDRFAATVLGTPIPNLLQSYVSGLAGGQELTSLDWNRPAGMVFMKAAAGAQPYPVLLLPVKGEKEFLADFKDPVTGESAIEKSEDGGYSMKHPARAGDRLYLNVVGDYVALADTPVACTQMAAHLARSKAIFTRQCPVSGDFLLHLPVSRIWTTYQKDIEMGIDNIRGVLPMVMQTPSPAQADVAQAVVTAELDAVVAMTKQIDGMVIAGDLMDGDVRITKRITPKASTALAAFIAANPGAENLPYKGAIAPNSAVAMTAHLNPASFRSIADFVQKQFMPLVMPATSEQMQAITQMMDGWLKQLNGDMMAAFQMEPDKPGGIAGMQVQEVIGLVDATAGMKLVDDMLTHFNETRMQMGQGGSLSTQIKKLGATDGITSYRTVVSASGDPEMVKAIKAMYGDGFEYHLAPAKTGMVFATDKSMVQQVVTRADAGATASFHPLEGQGTPRKIMMMRYNMIEMLRMGQRLAAAEGAPMPFQLPASTNSSGVLILVGTDKGDMQGDLLIPGSEIKLMAQMVMGAMAGGQPAAPPPTEPQPESY